MDLPRLIDAISDPAAYPHPVEAVEVRQTHISAVFLAGDFVYKVKKPVSPGFLDFTTLEKRRHFCAEEVRLNRRLAPDVYLGVVPITDGPDGVRVEGSGEAVEWAVKMRRLPDGASLLERLQRNELGPELLAKVAGRVAAFHAAADGGPRVAACGAFDVVAANARDNFTQSEAHVGGTVGRAVFDRLRELNEGWLTKLRPLVEARAARGVPRDTHGDLHLDHVYHFPDRPPPADLVVIDCIEFSERFRFADPVADMAFAVMDLKFRGRRDLAGAFADAYFRAANDADGAELLPFYTAYRAAVRGKVEGMKATEPEVPEESRSRARDRARGYWLLALAELEEPNRRPCLVLVGGLPGSGKSTLARGLAEGGFTVVRSDVVRKELAGLPAEVRGGPEIYSPEWTDRTYEECLRRAEELLLDGGRVIVDATFVEEDRRRTFLDAAVRLGVPTAILICKAHPDVIRARLAARAGDASDADFAVHQQAAARWEEPGPHTRANWHDVPADGNAAEALSAALAVLRGRGLC